MDGQKTPIAVAVAARPYPGEAVSGDAWHLSWQGAACRLAVIDGLGHGRKAAEAAAAAVATLAALPNLDPVGSIEHCHAALAGTRGAAMLVARIDAPAGRLTIAGLGNVEARLCRDGRCQHLMTDRGIVGHAGRRIHPVDLEIGADWLVLVHTDGVRNRLDLAPVVAAHQDAQGLANAVLTGWGRETDDATVLVARPRWCIARSPG